MKKLSPLLAGLALGLIVSSSAQAHDRLGFGIYIGSQSLAPPPVVTYYPAPHGVYYSSPRYYSGPTYYYGPPQVIHRAPAITHHYYHGGHRSNHRWHGDHGHRGRGHGRD